MQENSLGQKTPEIHKEGDITSCEPGAKRGMSLSRVGRLYGMPKSTVGGYVQKYNTGELTFSADDARPVRRSVITDAGHIFLKDFVTTNNTATLEQMRTAYQKKHDVILSSATIYRHLLRKCSLTLKQAQRYPVARTSTETKEKWENYMLEHIQDGKLDYLSNCVFIDEASFTGTMTRNSAWSIRGTAAYVNVPAMRTASKILLAAIGHTGLVEATIRTAKEEQRQ
ncbi:hypothetical protein BDB00DRAFT_876286 [Zychaea mexicana]|uniref:uncharacterized protein n=1 Tax=Zychaea mexicana TaxID=64656 RepID=UPI0022FF283F|nr:uncharacterized protein BDB00DRAFT_876286 [Zychaea mexicana]KAI9489522.1 hypothetical protein BDB00DRAFT_876286 [Zychaea mexicana]